VRCAGQGEGRQGEMETRRQGDKERGDKAGAKRRQEKGENKKIEMVDF